jgi:predicted 3-demethylubiquinone-9 3-methyltransferase (glyoxalase superfamily)
VNVLNSPSGEAELVSFELAGLQFQAISAGPYFKFNPSISLMVACESVEEVNAKWEALSEGGTELMALGEYPFNKRYGWIQDRYGLSWQLMLTDNNQRAQKITPSLLFSGDSCGKAEEALVFYTEIFTDSVIDFISKYKPGEAATPKAKINYAAFKLAGMNFSAMDNGYEVDFNFNEAFSLIVNCKDQKEIDYFWDRLSAVPEAEQCGWVKDRYGVSWQIVPDSMDEILSNGTKDEIQRIQKELLKMKKIDIEALEKARFNG